MREDIRIDTVRCILLALTKPPGSSNLLFTDSRQDRKIQLLSEEGRPKFTTRFALRRQALCLCSAKPLGAELWV
eukprot:IDg7942t1